MPMGAPARSARALAVAAGLGCALPATAARAASADNDTLFRAIQDLCVAPRGTVDEAAGVALRADFHPRDMGRVQAPLYGREVGSLLSGGTVVTYQAPSRDAPVAKCTLVSYSDDAAGLVARLRGTWGLPEPVKLPIEDNGWQVTHTTTVDGREMTVDLNFSLQNDNKAGGFILTLIDATAKVNDTLLAAIREVCIKPHGSVEQTAHFAMQPPFNGTDIGALGGASYGSRIALETLGRGRTRLMFIGESPSAPVRECHFDTSASYDLRDLIARLRTALALPEATQDSDPRFWRVTARSSTLGPIDVDLTYALQGDQQLDLFHLSVKR